MDECDCFDIPLRIKILMLKTAVNCLIFSSVPIRDQISMISDLSKQATIKYAYNTPLSCTENACIVEL